MKVTLQSDWTNNTQFLAASVKITLVEGDKESNAGGITAAIAEGDMDVYMVEIPEDTESAIFTLSWQHDWTKFPTPDLDMVFASPSSYPYFDYTYLDGATLNSPEQQTIMSPEAGTWFVAIDGYAVLHGNDPYVLDVTIE